MPEDLKKYVIALTDGHPFFLNVICSKARQLTLLLGQTGVDQEVLVESLKELFFDSEGVLNQYFVNVVAKWGARFKGEHLLILVQLAHSVNKPKDLALSIRKSARETSRQLKELVDAELVVRNGAFYHFNDKLFRFWLRHVYHPKEFSLLVNARSKAANFRLELHKHIDTFLSSSRVSPRRRIVDLFRRFRNELVEFDSKGRQLPAFEEILDEGEGAVPARPIVAKTPGQSWVCQVLEAKSTEKDVVDFLRQSASFKSSRTRRVLVALNGMDHNAKLLAKNKKIWTLNLQKINTLMDFYGQSKIITFKNETPDAALKASHA